MLLPAVLPELTHILRLLGACCIHSRWSTDHSDTNRVPLPYGEAMLLSGSIVFLTVLSEFLQVYFACRGIIALGLSLLEHAVLISLALGPCNQRRCADNTNSELQSSCIQIHPHLGRQYTVDFSKSPIYLKCSTCRYMVRAKCI